MKTTYSAMIANLDNINYVGKVHKVERRVNATYELVVNDLVVYTEYTNNEKVALNACYSKFITIKNRVMRLSDNDPEELARFIGSYIRKTDRDGVVTAIAL